MQPLLERVKFLAIFASNLDEFYMVRVAGLKRRRDMGLSLASADGLTASEQLLLISERTQELVERQGMCFTDERVAGSRIRPASGSCAGIRIEDEDKVRLADFFTAQIFPVLTPLAVDPAHPFPYISGLSLNMAIIVRDPETGAEKFARVKVPNNVDRFIRVHRGVDDFLPLEDLIAAHLAGIVPWHGSGGAPDLPGDAERRCGGGGGPRRGPAQDPGTRTGPSSVRFAGAAGDRRQHQRPDLDLLLAELEVDQAETVEVTGLLDLSSLWQLYGLDRPNLKDPPFVPATHPAFVEGETPKSIFARLRDGDVLVHHPYESFATTVQRFIEQAADRPERTGHQADAVPDVRRFADCRCADLGSGGR